MPFVPFDLGQDGVNTFQGICRHQISQRASADPDRRVFPEHDLNEGPLELVRGPLDRCVAGPSYKLPRLNFTWGRLRSLPGERTNRLGQIVGLPVSACHDCHGRHQAQQANHIPVHASLPSAGSSRVFITAQGTLVRHSDFISIIAPNLDLDSQQTSFLHYNILFTLYCRDACQETQVKQKTRLNRPSPGTPIDPVHRAT